MFLWQLCTDGSTGSELREELKGLRGLGDLWRLLRELIDAFCAWPGVIVLLHPVHSSNYGMSQSVALPFDDVCVLRDYVHDVL